MITTERMASNEEIRARAFETSIPYADAVVHAPRGAHPFSSPGHYLVDEPHLIEYVAAAKAAVKGGRGPFEAYLERYVSRPRLPPGLPRAGRPPASGRAGGMGVSDYSRDELLATSGASEMTNHDRCFVGANLAVPRAGNLLAHLTHVPDLKVGGPGLLGTVSSAHYCDRYYLYTPAHDPRERIDVEGLLRGRGE